MKIKNDFVTNSSSTYYILAFAQKFLRKDMEKHFRFYFDEHFRCFDSRRKLAKFTQAEDLDWISEATARPTQFWGMTEECFNRAAREIEKGNFAVFVDIGRDKIERREKFCNLVRQLGGAIVYETSL